MPFIPVVTPSNSNQTQVPTPMQAECAGMYIPTKAPMLGLLAHSFLRAELRFHFSLLAVQLHPTPKGQGRKSS